MVETIVLLPDGEVLIGDYDGYGRVGDTDLFEQIGLADNPCIYHLSCWTLAGCPPYDAPSKRAEDQGFFIQPERYNIPNPLLLTKQDKRKKR